MAEDLRWVPPTTGLPRGHPEHRDGYWTRVGGPTFNISAERARRDEENAKLSAQLIAARSAAQVQQIMADLGHVIFNPLSRDALTAAWKTVLTERKPTATHYRAALKAKQREFRFPSSATYRVRRVGSGGRKLWETITSARWVDAEGTAYIVDGIGSRHERESRIGLIHPDPYQSEILAAIPLGMELSLNKPAHHGMVYLTHGLQIGRCERLGFNDLRWLLSQSPQNADRA